MESQFPHLLHINNVHHATTGSLGAKGKPIALQASINKVQGINSLATGCVSTDCE